jgi:hypothetical protein
MPLLAFVRFMRPDLANNDWRLRESPPLVWTATLIASSVKPNLC